MSHLASPEASWTGRATRHRAVNVIAAIAILVSALQPAAWAAPATPAPSISSQGRRFVSAATQSPYFPGVPISFGFGDNIHEPGLGCVYSPPELDLQFLMLERAESGYTATVIFFAPIRPLSELNGKPVTHTVDLAFKPPKGDSVVVDLSLTTGALTVHRGMTDLEDEAALTTAGLQADRLLFSVPDTLGIEPDWTVSATVVIAGDGPICDLFPVNYRQTATAPATVGSLTGEDPAGTITFPTYGVVPGPKLGAPLVSGQMPAGSKITKLHLEQDAQGGLVVVLTMNADVAKLAESDATGMFTVALNLAGSDFFGVIYPYSLDWIWTPQSGPMPPTARVFDPVYNGIISGTVPVTVDGKEVRFEFGGYLPVELSNANREPDPNSVPFGDFVASFVAPSTLAGTICLCPEDVVPDGTDPTAVIYEDFQYDIVGNLLSVTRLASGSVAYGWIDRDGRFLAENTDELYRGVIKFVPTDVAHDVGVMGVYVRKLDQQPERSAKTDDAIPFRTSSTEFVLPMSHSIKSSMRQSVRLSPISDDMIILIRQWMMFQGLVSSDLYEPGDLMRDIIGDGTDMKPESRARLEQLLEQTMNMSMPPASSRGGPRTIISSSTHTFSSIHGMPFPLPIDSPPSELQPTLADPDWAIRAGSFFLAIEDNPTGQMPALTGPWVDSRLLLNESSSLSSAKVAAPSRPSLALLARRQVTTRRSIRTVRRTSRVRG